MTSLKIYLQQSHRCQEFSHNDKNATRTSYARRCTKPLVQKYKEKYACNKAQLCRSNILGFLLYMYFWIIDIKARKD